MAAVRLGDGDRAPMFFLDSGPWVMPRSGVALQFQWHDSEEAARAARATSLAEIAFARWGARDGRAVQWFETLVPGTGITLHDGSNVFLAEVHRAEGWIGLRVQQGGRARMVRVEANQPDTGQPYLFEAPAAAGRAVVLHAWREDQVLCRLLAKDRPPVEKRLKPGETWLLPPDGTPLNICQVMAAAVAVPGDKIRAAYVEVGGRAMALREGASERVGDYRVAYNQKALPPDAVYTITVPGAHGAVTRAITLASGAHERIGSWVFSLAKENPLAPEGVALTAERRPGGASQMVGLVLFVLGSFGLVYIRFAKPRRVV